MFPVRCISHLDILISDILWTLYDKNGLFYKCGLYVAVPDKKGTFRSRSSQIKTY